MLRREPHAIITELSFVYHDATLFVFALTDFVMA